MITSILAILLKLPALFSILEKLALLILKEIEVIQKKNLIKQMEKAIQTSKTTKDTSKIENLFNPKSDS